MLRLAAPYPGVQTITLLPNPQFSDSEALTAAVSSQQTMDGTLHTYVKTKDSRRKLLFSFNLNRLKALELKAFIQAYYRSKITLTDHNDVMWIGNFTSNPFDLESIVDERQTFTLEFEGCEV